MHALHIGPLHIPLLGICAALGLMAGLTLCQVTARLARLDVAAVWDAALAVVFAAFVVSRALLVVGSWRSFLAAPLLVLSLPAVNDTGLLLTAAVAAVYLRWKRLPVLGFLDAMAPCAALVWAFLGLGKVLEGTREGMPTDLFLSVGRNPNGAGGVQPVELYTMLVGMVLCGVLIRVLTRQRPAGLACAWGLGLAGVAVFLLDFLRVPSELFVAAMLDPVQWLGLAMLVVGCALGIALPASREMGTTDAV